MSDFDALMLTILVPLMVALVFLSLCIPKGVAKACRFIAGMIAMVILFALGPAPLGLKLITHIAGLVCFGWSAFFSD